MESSDILDKDEGLKELLAKKHLIGTTVEIGQALSLLQQELAAAKEQLSEYVCSRHFFKLAKTIK
jgi:hypothetical protein